MSQCVSLGVMVHSPPLLYWGSEVVGLDVFEFELNSVTRDQSRCMSRSCLTRQTKLLDLLICEKRVWLPLLFVFCRPSNRLPVSSKVVAMRMWYSWVLDLVFFRCSKCETSGVGYANPMAHVQHSGDCSLQLWLHHFEKKAVSMHYCFLLLRLCINGSSKNGSRICKQCLVRGFLLSLAAGSGMNLNIP